MHTELWWLVGHKDFVSHSIIREGIVDLVVYVSLKGMLNEAA